VVLTNNEWGGLPLLILPQTKEAKQHDLMTTPGSVRQTNGMVNTSAQKPLMIESILEEKGFWESHGGCRILRYVMNKGGSIYTIIFWHNEQEVLAHRVKNKISAPLREIKITFLIGFGLSRLGVSR
jgi:hypothetical protein